MTKLVAVCVCVTISLFTGSVIAGTQVGFDPAQGWQKIAPGVYQRERNGTTERYAFGAAGAQYDRKWIQGHMADLQKTLNDEDEQALEDNDRALLDWQKALDGIPVVDPAWLTTPQVSQGGHGTYICSSYYGYGLDDVMVSSPVGATAIARAGFYIPPFGPAAPLPTAATVTVTAQFTASGSSLVTQSKTSYATSGVDLTAIANYTDSEAFSCKNATTVSSVSLTASACPGGKFYAALTKSSSTCASY